MSIHGEKEKENEKNKMKKIKFIRESTGNPVSYFHFTLIEIVTVLTIIIIIFSISLPAFLHMTKGQSVEIAAITIASKLNAVRGYAITHNKSAALVFITDEDVNSRYNYRAYRACNVKSDGEFINWVADEKWEYLPTGIVLLGITNNKDIIKDYSKAKEIDKVEDPIFTGKKKLKGIIFKPAGDTKGARKIVIVGSGVFTGKASPNEIKQLNTANKICITVDNYTGRVSYGSD